METALENRSKEGLLKVISDRNQVISEQDQAISGLTQEISYLKAQIAMYKRMQFGQKRERFDGDPNQATLPFEAEPQTLAVQQEQVKQKIEYVRKRPNHHGRAKLPPHLAVEEIEIHPPGDLTEMVCIRQGNYRGTGM